MLADHAVRESQMIMSKRVAGIILDHDAMAFDCFGVVFHTQEIVCERIANLLVGRTALSAGAGADRRLENQRYQCNQANTRTPKAQQLLNSLRTTIPAGRNKMLAGIFVTKKRAACFTTLRAKKGVVPVVASRTNPASRNRPSAGGKANVTPRP